MLVILRLLLVAQVTWTSFVIAGRLGTSCSSDDECDGIEFSRCYQNYCTCLPYYAIYNSTTCLPSTMLGFECQVHEQCSKKVANSTCMEGFCRCEPGFLQFRRHTCLTAAKIGDICYSDTHCQLSDEDTHCDVVIANLFGRCACNAPLRQSRSGMCLPNVPPPSTSTSSSLDFPYPAVVKVGNEIKPFPFENKNPKKPTGGSNNFQNTAKPNKTVAGDSEKKPYQGLQSNKTKNKHTWSNSNKTGQNNKNHNKINSNSKPGVGYQKPSKYRPNGQLSIGKPVKDNHHENHTNFSSPHKPNKYYESHKPLVYTTTHPGSIIPNSNVKPITAGNKPLAAADSTTTKSVQFDNTGILSGVTVEMGESATGASSKKNLPKIKITVSNKDIAVSYKNPFLSTSIDGKRNNGSSSFYTPSMQQIGNLFMAKNLTDTQALTTNYSSTMTVPAQREEIEEDGHGEKEILSLGYLCKTDEQCMRSDNNSRCIGGICDCSAHGTSAQPDRCSAKHTGCHAGTFQCKSTGSCISWFFVCDGRRDCSDGSDEDCKDKTKCPEHAFQCGISVPAVCVSQATRCDGTLDCPNGEDELNCSATVENGCPQHTFQCSNGECIPEYEFCNAVITCEDGSDEPNESCMATATSTPSFALLNSNSDLLSSSSLNTSSSTSNNYYCPFKCRNGRCRSSAVVCSGRDGCGDNSDENRCNICKCPLIL